MCVRLVRPDDVGQLVILQEVVDCCGSEAEGRMCGALLLEERRYAYIIYRHQSVWTGVQRARCSAVCSPDSSSAPRAVAEARFVQTPLHDLRCWVAPDAVTSDLSTKDSEKENRKHFKKLSGTPNYRRLFEYGKDTHRATQIPINAMTVPSALTCFVHSVSCS